MAGKLTGLSPVLRGATRLYISDGHTHIIIIIITVTVTGSFLLHCLLLVTHTHSTQTHAYTHAHTAYFNTQPRAGRKGCLDVCVCVCRALCSISTFSAFSSLPRWRVSSSAGWAAPLKGGQDKRGGGGGRKRERGSGEENRHFSPSV